MPADRTRWFTAELRDGEVHLLRKAPSATGHRRRVSRVGLLARVAVAEDCVTAPARQRHPMLPTAAVAGQLGFAPRTLLAMAVG